MDLAGHKSGAGKLDPTDAMSILRAHNGDNSFEPQKGSMDCLCLHATGWLTPSQTTASMVAELGQEDACAVWFTGSSAPCLSLFKPLYTDLQVPGHEDPASPTSQMDLSYWWQWEEWHRMALSNYRAARKLMVEVAGDTEAKWMKKAVKLKMEHAGRTERLAFTKETMDTSREILLELKEKLRKEKTVKTGWIYRHHWRKWNRLAGMGNGAKVP
jgi:dipeptidase